MPHPQLGVLDIQGVRSEGQTEVVIEEPADTIALSAVEFQCPRIFVHALQYKWRLEVHVQGLDEEARQWIVVMEDLLHRFCVRTKARE